jgi:quercetin dioxygenase-like cupin family protein
MTNSTFLANTNFDNTFNALPREIFNKVTGDKLKIIPSTERGSLSVEFTLPPNAKGAPPHYHLNFTETFEVLRGRFEMNIGKTKQILAPGDFVEIKPGTLHGFNNPFSESVTFVSVALPAAEFEKFIRTMFGLANDGKTNQDGMPTNFLHLFLALDFADLYFPFVPACLQRAVRKALRSVAKITGAENELKKYFQETV